MAGANTPIIGSLDPLMNMITEADVKLKSLYKSAAFTCQAIVHLQTGVFEKKQANLSQFLMPEDKSVIDTRLSLNGVDDLLDEEFVSLTDILIKWASEWIQKVKGE